MEKLKVLKKKVKSTYDQFGGVGQRLILGFCCILAVLSVVTLSIVFYWFAILCIVLIICAVLTGFALLLGDMLKGF